MNLELRKFTKFVDKTYIEGGKEAKEPVLLVSVAAVFKNPWHGQGFVENLRPVILDLAPKLGDILVPELIKEIGSPDKILAYGKAGVVGLDGEIEHASAFIHTLRFGNKSCKITNQEPFILLQRRIEDLKKEKTKKNLL